MLEVSKPGQWQSTQINCLVLSKAAAARGVVLIHRTSPRPCPAPFTIESMALPGDVTSTFMPEILPKSGGVNLATMQRRRGELLSKIGRDNVVEMTMS